VLKGLRILIVDDNEVNREVAGLMLEQEHAVTTAANGLEALKTLAAGVFDCILMDVQMPVMDGLSATAAIRALERGEAVPATVPYLLLRPLADRLTGSHIPIVAMTAHAMSEDRKMCLSAGMDRYLTKPFQYNQLTSVLRSLLGDVPARYNSTSQAEKEAPPYQPAGIEDIVSHFKKETNFTDDQIARLVAASRTSIGGNLAKASIALRDGDFQALGRAAHTLKGTLLQCGLSDWARIAQEIHTSTMEKRDAPFAELLENIKDGTKTFLECREQDNSSKNKKWS
jgi:CheY-like chemotaxis protein